MKTLAAALALLPVPAQAQYQGARPLDWEAVASGPERVIYVGESHALAAPKAALQAALPALRKAGITHLGLEFSSKVETKWGEPAQRAYRELVAAAKERKIEPILLNKPSKGCSETDCRMARQTERVLSEDGKNRILVLVGAWHALKHVQPRRLSEAHGRSSRSYAFVDRLDDTLFDQEGVLAAHQKGPLRDRSVLVPLPVEAGFHGLIVVPEAAAEGKEYRRRHPPHGHGGEY